MLVGQPLRHTAVRLSTSGTTKKGYTVKKSLIAQYVSITLAGLGVAHAQTTTAPADGKPVPVTVDNFVRAESDMYSQA